MKKRQKKVGLRPAMEYSRKIWSSISTDNLSNSSAAVNVNIGTSRTAGIATTVLANNNVNTFLEFSAEL